MQRRRALLLAAVRCCCFAVSAVVVVVVEGEILRGTVELCTGEVGPDAPCRATIHIGDQLVIKCDASTTLVPAEWHTVNGSYCKEDLSSTNGARCPSGQSAKWTTLGVAIAKRANEPFYVLRNPQRVASFITEQKAFVGCFSPEGKKNYVAITFIPRRRPYSSVLTHTCNAFMGMGNTCNVIAKRGDTVKISCSPFPNVEPSSALQKGGAFCTQKLTGGQACPRTKPWSAVGVTVTPLGGGISGAALHVDPTLRAQETALGLCERSGQKKGMKRTDFMQWSIALMPETRQDIAQLPPGSVQCSLGSGHVNSFDKPCFGQLGDGEVVEVDCTGLNDTFPDNPMALCKRPFRDENDRCIDGVVLYGGILLRSLAAGEDQPRFMDPVRRFSFIKGKNGSFHGRCFNRSTGQSLYFTIENKSSSHFNSQLSTTTVLLLAATTLWTVAFILGLADPL